MTGGGFTQWGFELHAEPENRENGYITWVGGGREAWILRNSAIGPNPRVDVGQRLIPEEPMAMVSLLSLSPKDEGVSQGDETSLRHILYFHKPSLVFVSVVMDYADPRSSIAECQTIGRT